MKMATLKYLSLSLAVCGVGLSTCARVVMAQPVLRWTINATVVQVVDLDGIFSAVRLGDEVRGTMSYDLSTVPGFVDVGFDHYVHPPFFPIASMIIHNARDGTDLEFVAAEGGAAELAEAFVFNDYDSFGTGTSYDGVGLTKSVVAPPGFTGSSPAVLVQFAGPTTTYSSTVLPSELSLDSWTAVASIRFDDAFDSSGLHSSIYAEIYALTPIAPGDFDSDGAVDGADLAKWKTGYGRTSNATHREGDANGDFIVDGADFLIWQQGQMTVAVSTTKTVPESSALHLFFADIIALIAYRRLQSAQLTVDRTLRPLRLAPRKRERSRRKISVLSTQ